MIHELFWLVHWVIYNNVEHAVSMEICLLPYHHVRWMEMMKEKKLDEDIVSNFFLVLVEF